MPVTRLHTARLTLEPLVVGRDASDVLGLYADPRFSEFLASGPLTSIEQVTAYLSGFEELPEGQGCWLARRRDDASARVIGRFSLRPWKLAVPGDPLEVGWFLDVGSWGQGFAEEAMSAVLEYAADHPRQPRVIALVRHDNVASARLARRLGGVVTGQGQWYGDDLSLRFDIPCSPRARAESVPSTRPS